MTDSTNFDFLTPILRPCTTVKLPSRGVLYTGELAKGVVDLSPMTMAEETLLASGSGGTEILPLVDEVLRRCITSPSHVDIREFISADKYFLLIMLRAVTFGSEYSFIWTCNNTVMSGSRAELCGYENTQNVHIPEDFQVKTLDPADKEPYTLELPETKKVLSIKLLRGHDEIAIDEYEKKLAKQDKHKASVYSLVRQIVVIDGNKITTETPQDRLIAFVSSLPAKDIGALRDTVEFYTPGIDTSLKVQCQECGHEEEMDLPLSIDFFRAEPTQPTRPPAVPVRPDVLPEHEYSGNNDDAVRRVGMATQEISGSKEGGAGSKSS